MFIDCLITIFSLSCGEKIRVTLTSQAFRLVHGVVKTYQSVSLLTERTPNCNTTFSIKCAESIASTICLNGLVDRRIRCAMVGWTYLREEQLALKDG
jgi:hypothetical protein